MPQQTISPLTRSLRCVVRSSLFYLYLFILYLFYVYSIFFLITTPALGLPDKARLRPSMPDIGTSPLIAHTASPPLPSPYTGTHYPDSGVVPGAQMAGLVNSHRWGARTRYASAWVVASGVLDWLLIVATAVGGFYLGEITPNKRPFQLEDPDIS